MLKRCPTCSPALAFLATIYSAHQLLLAQQGNREAAQQAASDGLQALKALEVMDPVRAVYWQLQQAQLQMNCQMEFCTFSQ